jgi:ribosomal protein S18 acetylase RimI-like enzyme
MTVRFELRAATAADREPLYQLHRATMRDVVERTWGWDEAWQRAHFESRFAPAALSLLVVDGRAVGMIALQERPAELYVAALEIEPAMQGRGLGTAVMEAVVAQAAARGVPATLQVLELNEGARRLYERLGFRAVGRVEHHIQMRRDAPAPGGEGRP